MTTSGTPKLPDYLIALPDSGTESDANRPSGKELYFIPAGHSWDDRWELTTDLHVEVSNPQEEIVAVACLDLQEYGLGDSLESAITDLLTSLSDYCQSLESRESKLAPSASEDLTVLRRLLHNRLVG